MARLIASKKSSERHLAVEISRAQKEPAARRPSRKNAAVNIRNEKDTTIQRIAAEQGFKMIVRIQVIFISAVRLEIFSKSSQLELATAMSWKAEKGIHTATLFLLE